MVTMADDPEVYRATPASDVASGVGVLVLRGSSGLVDRDRVDLCARHGALAEGLRWFGGPGQQPGPYEVPLETFGDRVAALRRHCDRVVLIGTSFGAEAALATAAHLPGIDAVVAFAPSDVVWAGVRADGGQTSHWTIDGQPLPYLRFVEDWAPEGDPPAFRSLYEQSWASDPLQAAAATIPVERIGRVVLVAGGDDQVWPSSDHARRIAQRRASHGLPTTVVELAAAGHHCTLPGEPPGTGGMRMARGGSDEAAAELGRRAWPHLRSLLAGR